MKDFNRKVEDASARVNKSVAEAADRMEKETAEFITYLNDGGRPSRPSTLHQSVASRGREDVEAGRLSGRGQVRAPVRWSLSARILIVGLVAAVVSGCGGKKQARVNPPPPPPMAAPPVATVTVPNPSTSKRTEATPLSKADKKQQEKADEIARELSVPEGTKPLSVETGNASWYGAPYHNRRGSNGEIYDMHQLTAAHRTLPLGSTVRVTNLKTGHFTVVRITDRGPFVEGRIVDLSLAAAKQADIWQAGVAKVRLEVLRTPVPFDHGGRWAVQIGSFPDEGDARTMANRLSRRYKTAKVLSFGSPVGDWWVRVRVLQDDRARAEEVARDTKTAEGKVFLVRLD